MVQAQKWLESQEQYNTKEKRSKEIKLDIGNWDYKNGRVKSNREKLEGELDLNDFVNLEELFCYDNKLTSLKLDNCSKLRTRLNVATINS